MVRVVWGLLSLCFFLWSASASADTRVVVRAFPGPGGAEARASLVRVLIKQEGVQVVPNDEVDAAARNRGLPADTPLGRKEVGEELGVPIWIEGSTRRKKAAFALTVVALDTESQEVARFTSVSWKVKQFKVVGGRIWAAIGPAVVERANAQAPVDAENPKEPTALPDWGLAQPAPSQPSEPLPAPPQRIDGDPERPRTKRALTGLQLALTMNALHRRLTFKGPSSPDLMDYRLGAGPLGDLSARLYPFAFSNSGWLSCIGIDLRGQMAFPLTSESHTDAQYDTSYQSFGAGLVGRIPFNRHELNAVVDYNAQRFRIDDAEGKSAPVPSVDYRAIRYGLGARVAVSERVHLSLEAAWLQIRTSGELATVTWFPRAQGMGIESALYADIRLLGPVSMRARLAFQRAYINFHPLATDRRPATGAVDDYLTGGLGLAIAF